MDAEIRFGPPLDAENWQYGYVSTLASPYVDAGNAVCPESGTTTISGNCEDGAYTWTQGGVWQFAWGGGALGAIPEIYNQAGHNALQWQQVNRWAYLNSREPVAILATLTQHNACMERGGCSDGDGTDNTPAAGFWQLYFALLTPGQQTGQRFWDSTDVTGKWEDTAPPAIS